MGNVDQLATLDLGVTFCDPPIKARLFERRVIAKGAGHRLDDKVQEIGFIGRVACLAGKDHPIGAASGQNVDACIP